MKTSNHYLLTGATGFIGRVIHEVLTNKGYLVTPLDHIGRIEISRPFNFDEHFNIDVVVHAAGKAHTVPKSIEDAKLFYAVNFEGTRNLCAALEKLTVKPKAFIFISTVAVYGLDSGKLITESHPLNGQTPYAKSKIMAENWLVDWTNKHQVKLGIIRLPLVAGPNPPGNLGAMIKGIQLGHYFSIGKANAQKSIVWHEDVASILPILSDIGGTFNLTDGHHPTFKELELIISRKAGKKLPISIPYYVARIAAFAGDLIGAKFPINSDKIKKITSTLTFDDTKACNTLGWKPNSVLSKLSETL